MYDGPETHDHLLWLLYIVGLICNVLRRSSSIS